MYGLYDFTLPTEQPVDWGDVVIPGLTDRGAHKVEPLPVGGAEGIRPSPFSHFPYGHAKWLNLLDPDLSLFFVIPEFGKVGYTPKDLIMYEVDGFWYAPIRDYWFKIPDGAYVWVLVDTDGNFHVQVQTYIPGFPPEWRSAAADPPTVPYPFK